MTTMTMKTTYTFAAVTTLTVAAACGVSEARETGNATTPYGTAPSTEVMDVTVFGSSCGRRAFLTDVKVDREDYWIVRKRLCQHK